jgi:6-phosphogluconolactonase
MKKQGCPMKRHCCFASLWSTLSPVLSLHALSLTLATMIFSFSQPAMIMAEDSATATTNAATTANSGSLLVYFGTGAQGDSKGIYQSRFNAQDGTLEPAKLAATIDNPTFLAIHPTQPWLYSASELNNSNDKDVFTMNAFRLDPKSGELTFLNHQTSGSHAECHLAVDPSGKNVLAASYSDGRVSCLPIEADGLLGKLSCMIQHEGASVGTRQKTPKAHGIFFDAANRFVFVPDLGIDKVMVYRLDAEHGKLTPNDPPSISMAPGAGPRHFVFHPNGRFAYVINEINSTVTAMTYDAQHGALETMQTVSTLPDAYQGKSTTAELQMHPSGKFLYGSNRGHDSIVIYAVDPQTGKLTLVGHESTQGKTPRHFTLDPTGNFLLAANLESNNIVVFRVDAGTGKLQPTGNSIAVPSPMCVLLVK